LDRGLVFGDLPPAVIRNRSDDFQQLDRSIRSRDRWHIEIEPQSDRLLGITIFHYLQFGLRSPAVSVLRIDHTALRGVRWSEVAREHAAPAQGAVVYAQKCAVCHGDKGEGKINARLVGGQITGDGPVVKTVGSYWPYATTLFDFVRRAMPWNQPKSLTNDEVYAVSATSCG
jgi:hypothetical protein